MVLADAPDGGWPDVNVLRVESAEQPARIAVRTAGLLTRDALPDTRVTELSRPELAEEADRVAAPRWVWPSGVVLGLGIACSLGGAISGIAALSTIGVPVQGFGDVLGRAVLVVMTIAGTGSGMLVGSLGGVLLRALWLRRDEADERRAAVSAHLADIDAGRVIPPELPPGYLELRELEDERPGFALPVVLWLPERARSSRARCCSSRRARRNSSSAPSSPASALPPAASAPGSPSRGPSAAPKSTLASASYSKLARARADIP